MASRLKAHHGSHVLPRQDPSRGVLDGSSADSLFLGSTWRGRGCGESSRPGADSETEMGSISGALCRSVTRGTPSHTCCARSGCTAQGRAGGRTYECMPFTCKGWRGGAGAAWKIRDIYDHKASKGVSSASFYPRRWPLSLENVCRVQTWQPRMWPFWLPVSRKAGRLRLLCPGPAFWAPPPDSLFWWGLTAARVTPGAHELEGNSTDCAGNLILAAALPAI